ncbi:MAG TPA: hypothetical protein PL033_13835 [Candidatus Brocadiia bacterium]|nr:hypothetical protein [Candidatus Brocadiia bacterium]
MDKRLLQVFLAITLCLVVTGCKTRQLLRDEDKLRIRSDQLDLRTQAADLRGEAAGYDHKAEELENYVVRLDDKLKQIDNEIEICRELIVKNEKFPTVDSANKVRALRAKIGQYDQMRWYYGDMRSETAEQARHYRVYAGRMKDRADKMERAAPEQDEERLELEIVRVYKGQVTEEQLEAAKAGYKARKPGQPETTFSKPGAPAEPAPAAEPAPTEEKSEQPAEEKKPEGEEAKPEATETPADNPAEEAPK